MMRFIYFLFLVVFAGAVAVFAVQNQDAVPLRFDVGVFQWSETVNLALLVGVTYLLGMLSGWTVVGLLRRSLRQVVHDVQHRHPSGRLDFPKVGGVRVTGVDSRKGGHPWPARPPPARSRARPSA